MTNTTYFFNTIREEWSASTSPNDSPRPSLADVGNVTLYQEASSPSSAVVVSAIDNDGCGLSASAVQSESQKLQSSKLKSLSFKQIKTATRKFHPDGLVGESGLWQVYQGWIEENKLTPNKPESGIAFAVKKLDGLLRFGRAYKAWVRQNSQKKLTASEPDRGVAIAVSVRRINQHGLQGHHGWLDEIKYLGQLNHPNLVRLFGHCTSNKQRLLAYEFMPRGSLSNYLFDKSSSYLLSWNIRMKIALGTARGLAFLHSAEVHVVHRGVTSCNILLDIDYSAKLSNFVSAMDGLPEDKGHISTAKLEKTCGYRAPEYTLTGHLSAKTDVYAFGMVLLEIISGRSHQMFGPSKEQNLLEWGRPFLKDSQNIFLLVDSCLEGQYSPAEAQRVAKLAYHCVSMAPKCRPNMDEVVKVLEDLQQFQY